MSDNMLALTIIFIAGIFISNLWIRQDLNRVSLILEKLIGFYILPAFLTYAMLLISSDNKIKKQWWWFGSFAIVSTIFIFIDLFVLNEYDNEGLIKLYKSPPFLYHIFFRGSNIFAFVALLWFIKKLKQYRMRIENNYSFIDTIRFKWLENFTWAFFINNLLILVIALAYNYLEIDNLKALYSIVYLLIVISLFYLCYHGIRQYSLAEYNNSIGFGYNKQELIQASEKKEGEKYKSSSLSSEEMNNIFKQIKILFEVEKIYLEPQLKILDLSLKLEATTHTVSQTINSITQESFYDFVNCYRVEHFKKLLSNPENRKFTILALGIESGFNSKASLNRIFKQYVKISPKEFQINQNNI